MGVLPGEDVGDLQQQSLRRHLAVVPQDTVLLNDTILENIRYGNLDASDEEVRTLPAARPHACFRSENEQLHCS